MTTVEKRQRVRAPKSACQLRAGRCEFAEPSDVDGVRKAAIKLTASSGQVFNARWWGPLVFDYAGMTWAKDRLALDYCHRDDEIVGFADQLDVSQGNLSVAGQLVSTRQDDRAREVMDLGAAGVPYEASIAFDPRNNLVIEEWQPGTTAEVNGRQVPGPVTVIRQCLLRGVAVCPHGADPYTESAFSAGDPGEVVELTVIKHLPEGAMSQETSQVAAATEAKTAEQIRTELRQGHAEFVAKYGAELAAKWGPLGEGELSMDSVAAHLQAVESRHAAALQDLQTKLDAQTGAVTELQNRLQAIGVGETKPVSTAPPGAATPQEQTALQAGLTPRLAGYVAACRARKAAAH